MKKVVFSDHTASQVSQAQKMREDAYVAALALYEEQRKAKDALIEEAGTRMRAAWKDFRVFAGIGLWFVTFWRTAFGHPVEPRRQDAGRDERVWAVGQQGEGLVARYLESKLSDEWTLVSGYRNSRGEIDQVLVGPDGVASSLWRRIHPRPSLDRSGPCPPACLSPLVREVAWSTALGTAATLDCQQCLPTGTIRGSAPSFVANRSSCRTLRYVLFGPRNEPGWRPWRLAAGVCPAGRYQNRWWIELEVERRTLHLSRRYHVRHASHCRRSPCPRGGANTPTLRLARSRKRAGPLIWRFTHLKRHESAKQIGRLTVG